jgi:FKBP-type peptidyl-prolyl cis-trans isomerase
MTFLRSTVVAALLLSSVNAFHVTSPPEPATRRELLTNALIFATALTANQKEAEASGRGYHISRKLKAKEAKLQESVLSLKLPSGVAIQQIRDGRSGFEVKPGSLVTAEIKLAGIPELAHTIRAKFQVGSGRILSGLEEGLLGMNLHGFRRIIVPEHVVKQGQKQGQLPLPQMTAQQLEEWTAAAANVLQYEVQILGLN